MRTPKLKVGRKKNIHLYKDEEAKSEEDENCIKSLKDEIKWLNEQLGEKQLKIRKSEKYGDLLSDLFQKWIIDDEGNFMNDKL